MHCNKNSNKLHFLANLHSGPTVKYLFDDMPLVSIKILGLKSIRKGFDNEKSLKLYPTLEKQKVFLLLMLIQFTLLSHDMNEEYRNSFACFFPVNDSESHI